MRAVCVRLKVKVKVKRRVEFPACCVAGPSCADGAGSNAAAAAGGRTPARVKSTPKQTVDRGVGPTPAPSPRDLRHHHSQLPLYLGAAAAVPPPYLRDPRHQSFIDAGLGQFTARQTYPLRYPKGRFVGGWRHIGGATTA